GPRSEAGVKTVDLAGEYLAPGFVDLHVHGGDGHDFMDGTTEAFRAICRAHLRHGTTSLLPTSTLAPPPHILPLPPHCPPSPPRPRPRSRVGRPFLRPLLRPQRPRLPSR